MTHYTQIESKEHDLEALSLKKKVFIHYKV